MEAGLSGAAIYALYKPIAYQDHKAINSVVSAAKRFYTQAGYIFISLTLGLAVFYPLFIKIQVLNQFEVMLLILVLGVNGALEFLTLSKYRVLLSADQRTYVISLASLVHVITNTIIIIVLGVMQVNIVILRFVALLSIFLRSFILMVYTKKKYKFLDFSEKPNFQALNKRWDALYLQILGVIHTGAPIVILTLITKNLKLVSVYTIFNMILAGISGVLSIFISGLSASFGDVIAKGETTIMQKAYNEFEYAYYAIITLVYSIAFTTIMPFIRIYTSGVTDINYDISIVGFLFVMNGLLYNIKTPQGMLVISAGLYRETRIQTTIQGAIAVVIGIILTPFYGIKGVLIASILSNIYRDIDLFFFIPRNVTKLPIKNTVFRVMRLGISVFFIYLPFLFIKLTPRDYISWMLNALAIGVYAIVVILGMSLFFERDTLKAVYIRFFRMVKQ